MGSNGKAETPMSSIESEYQPRMDALAGNARSARSTAMLKWTREMFAHIPD